MRRPLAFVLSGGGARGALQVGALRALLEAGFRPDLLVGTSIGAANAAFLAVNGVSLQTVDALSQTWRDAAAADLMPANYLWLTLRVLFNRTGWRPYHRMREFLHRSRSLARPALLGYSRRAPYPGRRRPELGPSRGCAR